MKICSTCGAEKPLSEYFRSSARKDGYEHRCKKCKVQVNRASYNRNKEQVKLNSIKRKYKLNAEQYYELIGYGCNACGSNANLSVDHDHSCCSGNYTCGKCIRGALCRRCNIAEGLFKDDGENILKLIDYMKKHGIIK